MIKLFKIGHRLFEILITPNKQESQAGNDQLPADFKNEHAGVIKGFA